MPISPIKLYLYLDTSLPFSSLPKCQPERWLAKPQGSSRLFTTGQVKHKSHSIASHPFLALPAPAVQNSVLLMQSCLISMQCCQFMQMLESPLPMQELQPQHLQPFTSPTGASSRLTAAGLKQILLRRCTLHPKPCRVWRLGSLLGWMPSSARQANSCHRGLCSCCLTGCQGPHCLKGM